MTWTSEKECRRKRGRERERERERPGRPVSIPQQTAVDNHGL